MAGITGLHFLVVEDEPSTRDELVCLLREMNSTWAIDEAASGDEAVRLISTGHYDAAFVDISMPGLNGMDVARLLARLERRPEIVFITAYESFAIEAFSIGAIDYILKPVRPQRLREAVGRIAAKSAPAEINLDELNTIEVELAGRTVYVQRSDISYVEAHGDYVRLHIGSDSHLIRQTLSSLETIWEHAGFVRTHRSFLVNLPKVTQLQASSKSGLFAVTEAGHVPVSRRHAHQLRTRLVSNAQRTGPEPV